MTELLPFCECGECGLRVTKKGNRFINGHNSRGDNNPSKLPGVGRKISEAQMRHKVSDKTRKKISTTKKDIPNSPEHNAAISAGTTGSSKPPRTPEHIAALSTANSKAHTGVPLSLEHSAAISDGMKNSDAVKANADKMRGGDDICDHHYIYDHAHPELYTMKVTRSKHAQIHAWMRKAGIKVPHINVPDDQSKED